MSINIINISNISGAYIGNNISHQLILNTPINFKNSSINIVPIMVIMTFFKERRIIFMAFYNKIY